MRLRLKNPWNESPPKKRSLKHQILVDDQEFLILSYLNPKTPTPQAPYTNLTSIRNKKPLYPPPKTRERLA